MTKKTNTKARDAVFRAAENILSSGQKPSINLIRGEVIGVGQGLVARYLSQWWTELGKKLKDRKKSSFEEAESAFWANVARNKGMHRDALMAFWQEATQSVSEESPASEEAGEESGDHASRKNVWLISVQ